MHLYSVLFGWSEFSSLWISVLKCVVSCTIFYPKWCSISELILMEDKFVLMYSKSVYRHHCQVTLLMGLPEILRATRSSVPSVTKLLWCRCCGLVRIIRIIVVILWADIHRLLYHILNKYIIEIWLFVPHGCRFPKNKYDDCQKPITINNAIGM